MPFIDLNLVLEVKFSILQDEMPSLLSKKDLIDNGLNISLHGVFLHIGDLRQPLILDNYFFVHKWSSSSIPYFLYTESELR